MDDEDDEDDDEDNGGGDDADVDPVIGESGGRGGGVISDADGTGVGGKPGRKGKERLQKAVHMRCVRFARRVFSGVSVSIGNDSTEGSLDCCIGPLFNSFVVVATLP